VTGEEVGLKKPDPAAYLQVLDGLGLTPGEWVAFEDSRNGLLAAKAAGLPVVLTPNLYTEDEDLREGDCVVSDLGELEHSLRHIRGWKPAADVINLACGDIAGALHLQRFCHSKLFLSQS
jgi:beta-phosphoglucomutase-like phosphatase (HAD superfamily)